MGDLECSCRKIFANFALPIVKDIILDILLAAIFSGSKPAVLLGKDDLLLGCQGMSLLELLNLSQLSHLGGKIHTLYYFAVTEYSP